MKNEMNAKKYYLTIFIALASAYVLRDYLPGWFWFERTGILIDRSTNKPISGAIVLARWRGDVTVLADTQNVCYHIETTTTDENGEYAIPAWIERLNKWHVFGSYISIDFYYPGYEEVGAPDNSNRYFDDTGYMVPFSSDDSRTYREQRLEYLSKNHTACYATDGSKNNTIPLLEGKYAEAISISKSNSEFVIACRLLSRIESYRYGDMVALENLSKCTEKYK